MSNTTKIKTQFISVTKYKIILLLISMKSEFSKTIEKRRIDLDVRASVSYKVDIINFMHVYFDELNEYIVPDECLGIK